MGVDCGGGLAGAAYGAGAAGRGAAGGGAAGGGAAGGGAAQGGAEGPWRGRRDLALRFVHRRGVPEQPAAAVNDRGDEPDDEDQGHDRAEGPLELVVVSSAFLFDGAGQRRRRAGDGDGPDPGRGAALGGQVAAQAQLARHLERAGDGERLGETPLA